MEGRWCTSSRIDAATATMLLVVIALDWGRAVKILLVAKAPPFEMRPHPPSRYGRTPLFHDGLSNAQKCGHPERKPRVEVQSNDTTNEFTVSVCNVAHPKDAPITAEIAAKILHGD